MCDSHVYLQLQLLSLPLQEAVLLPTAKLQSSDLGAPVITGQLEGVLQLPDSCLQARYDCGLLCIHLWLAKAFMSQLCSLSAVQGNPSRPVVLTVGQAA